MSQPIKAIFKGKLRAWDLVDVVGQIREEVESALNSLYHQQTRQTMHDLLHCLQHVGEASQLLRVLEEIGELALQEVRAAEREGVIPRSHDKEETG